MKKYVYHLLNSIKIGQLNKKKYIVVKTNVKGLEFLSLLWDFGYILGFKYILTVNSISKVNVYLKYMEGMLNNSINNIKFLSKPGHKKFYTLKQLWKLNISNCDLIISTTKGIMSLNECKRKGLGGSPICIIK